jgi:hypothetical protein
VAHARLLLDHRRARPGAYTRADRMANTSAPEHDAHQLLCEPAGACAACPADADAVRPALLIPSRTLRRHAQASCGPFGTRRALTCAVPGRAPVAAWEACGRLPAVERADFFEFVGSNAMLAVLGLVLLFFRSRRAREVQAGRLAARIGVGR